MSQGITVFPTLADALRAGYHVYDRTAEGYLVRTRTAAGWAFAIARSAQRSESWDWLPRLRRR